MKKLLLFLVCCLFAVNALADQRNSIFNYTSEPWAVDATNTVYGQFYFDSCDQHSDIPGGWPLKDGIITIYPGETCNTRMVGYGFASHIVLYSYTSNSSIATKYHLQQHDGTVQFLNTGYTGECANLNAPNAADITFNKCTDQPIGGEGPVPADKFITSPSQFSYIFNYVTYPIGISMPQEDGNMYIYREGVQVNDFKVNNTYILTAASYDYKGNLIPETSTMFKYETALYFPQVIGPQLSFFDPATNLGIIRHIEYDNPNGNAQGGKIAFTDDGQQYSVGSVDFLLEPSPGTSLKVRMLTNASQINSSSAVVYSPGSIVICPVGYPYISSCLDKSILANPRGITMNPNGTFAYIVNQGDNSVTKCSYISNVLNECTNSGASGLNAPFGVAFNSVGTVAFITNTGNNSITQCSVDANGNLINCNNSGVTALDFPSSITVNPAGTMAFITNTGNSNSITYCTITSGGLTNCSYTIGADNFNQPIAMTFAGPNGNSVYITNFGSSIVTECGVDAKGLLSGCTNSGATNIYMPFGITLSKDGKTAYIVNNDNTITQCNAENGNLKGGCSKSAATKLNQPFGIILDKSGNTAFITNYANSVITQCNIENGTLSNCAYTANISSNKSK